MRGPRLRKVFVLDNYDSFTYNLVQMLGSLGASPTVERNDETTIEEIARRAPDAVVISPGPGSPSDAGISIDLVRWCFSSRTPLLGVCLGHQAIACAFGGRIVEAPIIMHGKTSMIHHDGAGALRGLPNPFEAMRYHSLVVDVDAVPDELVVTARTSDGVVMAIRHTLMDIEGVQFHPESILTASGARILENFLGAAVRAG
jgi:anthranilate synthase/aminodeoxychorismate synthase-like glutamine amidotransferase